MKNHFRADIKKLYTKSYQNISIISNRIFDFLMRNIKVVIIAFLIFSVIFSILKVLLFSGFNVDSYQYFALSIKDYILTGERSYLFDNYYARNRMMFPFLIAVFNIIFPFNVSILACILNLIFAVLTLWLIRLNLRKFQFQELVIDLTTLFIIVSYNFLNYWFNILTDFVGLLFFLLFILFLQRFISKKNFFDLAFSLVFYLYAVLSRELYAISIVLLIFIFKSRKTKIIVSSTFVVLVLTLILAIPEKLPFMNQFIASSYWEYYIDRKIFHLFFFLQNKWITPKFLSSFLKGLVKVGIIPVFTILIIIKRRNIRSLFTKFRDKAGLIFISWFIFFFIFYSLFYSNQSSASGLRYWLPISWIPLVYISNNIFQTKKYKNWKLLVILFLCLYPVTWSGMEWYINRKAPSGTGSILNSNLYFNDMEDIKTISRYDPKYLQISEINGTYFSTTVKVAALEVSEETYLYTKFSLDLWLNVSEYLIIEIRLKSGNNATWGFVLFEVKADYSPGYGLLRFSSYNLTTENEFAIFTFEIHQKFLLRYVTLCMNNDVEANILWDYIKIESY